MHTLKQTISIIFFIGESIKKILYYFEKSFFKILFRLNPSVISSVLLEVGGKVVQFNVVIYPDLEMVYCEFCIVKL